MKRDEVSPYCEVDGCHDTRTLGYMRGPATNGPSPTFGTYIYWSPVPAFAALLCRIHARQRFGVCGG